MAVQAIVKAGKVKLTAGRIAGFECPKDKLQAFLWANDPLGLAVRTIATGAKSYIYQTKIQGQSVRLTIGKTDKWSIAAAQTEARRLQTVIDSGDDPRQVKADKETAKVAAQAAKEAETAALLAQQARESVTMGDAWQVYVAERTAAKIDGKPVWGDRHRECHEYYSQAGGEKRTSGLRQGKTVTRQGALVPLMGIRLADIDADAVAVWLDKETAQAPAIARLAFGLLRAFIAWCARRDAFKAIVHADACQSDSVKDKVPTPKVKKNDCLRKAQIKPWFETVQKMGNPVISAYLQGLLLTGARRNELAGLRWSDVDFQWKSMTIRDKVEGERTIPLTPYLEHLISCLPRRNGFVFSSATSASGRLEEPRNPHNKALTAAALPSLSLHGLRRSFGTLSEWVEVPAGIVAQIMGHKPSAIAEKHYIQRELDLLHMWHVKIEAWILAEAGIQYVPVEAGLRVVKA